MKIVCSCLYWTHVRKGWFFVLVFTANRYLFGGLEHFLFFHTLGTIIPIDFHIFQRGRYTTNQIDMFGCSMLQFPYAPVMTPCEFHWLSILAPGNALHRLGNQWPFLGGPGQIQTATEIHIARTIESKLNSIIHIQSSSEQSSILKIPEMHTFSPSFPHSIRFFPNFIVLLSPPWNQQPNSRADWTPQR